MWGMPGKQSPTSNTTLYRFWTRHAIPMRKLNDPALLLSDIYEKVQFSIA